MKLFKTLLIVSLLLISLNSLYSKKVRLGIDVLEDNNFEILKNKKILLFTNYTGRNSDGKLTLEILKEKLKSNLIGVLIPEHGFYSVIPAGKYVPNDTLYGIPVFSIYGKNKKPSNELLKDCDAIVIDIQDIGVRSYTYISSMFKIIEASIENNIEVIILDRPNPLGGLIVDGNIIEKGQDSFVGIIPIPYIHGCTIGELALMANEEGWIKSNQRKAKINIVKMKNWNRWMVWEDTQLQWYPTSPNIPTVDAVRGYAVIGVFGELGIFSIGIGTTLPFQYIGAPYFNTDDILSNINIESFKGLKLIPIQFFPLLGMYKEKICNGILLKFEPNNNFMPYTYGFLLALAIKKVYPTLFIEKNIQKPAKDMFVKVIGNELIFKFLFETDDNNKMISLLKKGINEFLVIRSKYLLYE